MFFQAGGNFSYLCNNYTVIYIHFRYFIKNNVLPTLQWLSYDYIVSLKLSSIFLLVFLVTNTILTSEGTQLWSDWGLCRHCILTNILSFHWLSNLFIHWVNIYWTPKIYQALHRVVGVSNIKMMWYFSLGIYNYYDRESYK
jgi:hypothetical protein